MPKQNVSVSTDCVIFFRSKDVDKILLVKRKNDPYGGSWALPGGFLEEKEPLETGAARELEEETGIKVNDLHQIRAFGTPGRDPRGRTISIAFFGEVRDQMRPEASDDAAEADWFPINNLPELAFDHKEIVGEAIQKFHARNA